MTLNQLLRPISRLKSRVLAPSQAWSMYQVDALVSTYHSTSEFRISVDGVSVILTGRGEVEESRGQITILRQEFNKMIQWYMKPQQLRTVEQIARSVRRIAKEIDKKEVE